MKKIIIMILFVFLFPLVTVQANSFGKVTSLVNKCSVVHNSKAVIPVKVVGINNGLLSKNLDKYSLGLIDSDENKFKITIDSVKGKNIENILLDDNRNSDSKSYMYFYLNQNLNFKETEEILEFGLNVEFLDKIPDTFYVLGTEVVLSDNEQLCENLNNNMVIKNGLSDIQLKNKETNNIYLYIVIIILSLIIIFLTFLLLKKNKKK